MGSQLYNSALAKCECVLKTLQLMMMHMSVWMNNEDP